MHAAMHADDAVHVATHLDDAVRVVEHVDEATEALAHADEAVEALSHADEAVEGLHTAEETRYYSFTRRNFRRNLSLLIGVSQEEAKALELEAHHVLPYKFEDRFAEAGINIHDPHFGSWVERGPHRRWSRAYNREWEGFFERFERIGRSPTIEESFQKSRDTGRKVRVPLVCAPLAKEGGMQPDYQHLFEMRDPLATRPWRLTVREDPRWKTMMEEGKREEFGEWLRQLMRGEARADPPLRLAPAMGGHPTDVMWSTVVTVVVVSQRVVDLLRKEGLTGWAIYAVDVRDKKREAVPGYYGFAVIGRAGSRDLRRGEVIDKPPIVPGGKPYQVLRGLYFEEDYWDGRDFCLMGSTLTIVVTERVVRLFKRHRIRNVEFIRSPEVESNVSIFKIQGRWPPERG